MRPFISLSCSREDDRLAGKRLVRVLITLEENVSHILPELSLGRSNLPWAPSTVKAKHRRLARARATSPADLPAQRMRTQVPAATLEPALLPGPGMPARGPPLAGGSPPGQTSPGRPASKPSMPRQRKRRRQRAKTAPKAIENPEVAPARGHAAKIFFPLPLCDRPGCYEPPVTSPRNPARYCCAACRQAVRNVLDRERKWLSRGTLDGRKKRAIEYQAARRHRSLRQQSHRRRCAAAGTPAMTTPPRCAGRQLSRRSGRLF